MVCPKCGCEINPEVVDDICCSSTDEEQQEPAYAPPGSGVYHALALRFSINQFMILCGCVLLLISLGFPFYVFPESRFSTSYSGYSMIVDISRHGVRIGYRLIFEWLAPIILVFIFVSLHKKYPSSKYIVLGASIFGLFMGASTLLGSIGHGDTGIGLIAFVAFWVVVTVFAFLEYKGASIFEKSYVPQTE